MSWVLTASEPQSSVQKTGGAPGLSLEHLDLVSAQVMSSGLQDRTPHQAPYWARSLLEILPPSPSAPSPLASLK